MCSSSARPWRFYGLLLAIVIIAGGLLWIPFAEGDAVNAEEAYVAEQLENESCLRYGNVRTGAGGYEKEASVTGLTPFGYRIAVTVPYSFGEEIEDGLVEESEGELVQGDGASEAVYEVSPLGTRRISGDTISFC